MRSRLRLPSYRTKIINNLKLLLLWQFYKTAIENNVYCTDRSHIFPSNLKIYCGSRVSSLYAARHIILWKLVLEDRSKSRLLLFVFFINKTILYTGINMSASILWWTEQL